MIDMMGGGIEATEAVVDRLNRTKTNDEFLATIHSEPK